MDDNRHKTLNPIKMWLNRLAKERAGGGTDDPTFFVFITVIFLIVGGLVVSIFIAAEAALWNSALGWFAFLNLTVVALMAFAWYAYVVTSPEED